DYAVLVNDVVAVFNRDVEQTREQDAGLCRDRDVARPLPGSGIEGQVWKRQGHVIELDVRCATTHGRSNSDVRVGELLGWARGVCLGKAREQIVNRHIQVDGS